MQIESYKNKFYNSITFSKPQVKRAAGPLCHKSIRNSAVLFTMIYYQLSFPIYSEEYIIFKLKQYNF